MPEKYSTCIKLEKKNFTTVILGSGLLICGIIKSIFKLDPDSIRVYYISESSVEC